MILKNLMSWIKSCQCCICHMSLTPRIQMSNENQLPALIVVSTTLPQVTFRTWCEPCYSPGSQDGDDHPWRYLGYLLSQFHSISCQNSTTYIQSGCIVYNISAIVYSKNMLLIWALALGVRISFYSMRINHHNQQNILKTTHNQLLQHQLSWAWRFLC